MDILYVDDGYWDEGYCVEYILPPVPDWAVTPVTQILPSYLYQQYQPDDNVESFFTSYNTTAQSYLDYLVNLNLPLWTSDTITGPLLDWVGTNLYGFPRPILSIPVQVQLGGIYNTVEYNKVPYNQSGVETENMTVPVTDDVYKRCLTWNLYKGDGFQFNARWLKNRVQRFLSGLNGVAIPIDSTYNVSVTYGSSNSITITINPAFDSSISPILASAISEQILNLPFNYIFTVVY